jgi:hypothetical protein
LPIQTNIDIKNLYSRLSEQESLKYAILKRQEEPANIQGNETEDEKHEISR